MHTLRSLVLAVALLPIAAFPAAAAQKWGIDGEMIAQFEAKVVDMLCELSGDCPEACGEGTRQLGLLRDDGRLLLAVKSNTIFAGATLDLLPFCGDRVEVDGLVISHPAMVIYMVQRLRAPSASDWIRATAFAEDWQARNEQPDAKRWFRRDPMANEVIGIFGKIGRPDLMPPPAPE